MGSRTDILNKIKANKPDELALPTIDPYIFNEDLDLVKEFTKKVEVVGGNVYPMTSLDEVTLKINTLLPNTRSNFSTLDNSTGFNTFSMDAIKRPHELEDLDVLVLQSGLAVSENGAIWVEDSVLPMRILPFITKHLVFVIDERSIVPYMHQAYEKLNDFNFGVFISGPSKTADIEQSLVIGAHGALSLYVFLLK